RDPACNLPIRQQRQADLPIPGTGHGGELQRRDHLALVAGALKLAVRSPGAWMLSQVTILSSPSSVSTSAVRLSTQSPQLQYSSPSIVWICALWMCPHTTPSKPRRLPSRTSTCSKSLMKLTAFFTLCFRYCDSDQ